MKDENLSSVQIVTERSAVSLLLHPEEMIYLKPFIGSSRNVQDVAKELKLEMNFLYYRVKRFEKHGFLKEVRRDKRSGRAIKYYRCTQDHFFVPFTKASSETLEQFIELNNAHWQPQLTRGLANAFRDAANEESSLGLHISMDSNGMMIFNVNHHPDTMPSKARPKGVINTWETRFFLSDDDVETMRLELNQVLSKYLAKRSGKRRVLRVAMAAWEA